MKNCKKIEQKLIFYIDKELDVKETELVRAHLEECNACRMLYLLMNQSFEKLNNEKQVQSNPFFFTRVMEKVKTEPSKKDFGFVLHKQFALQFAAYAILVLFALFAGRYLGSGFIETDQATIELQTDTTDYQLFANSYNYHFNQNAYSLQVESNEK